MSFALAVLNLGRRAAWAPLAVIVAHWLVMRSPWSDPLNGVVHFSGGAAAAYFIFHAAIYFERWLGKLAPIAHILLAFGLTCAIAIGWEIAEFAFDQLMRTRIQMDLVDTMRDLICGVLGAMSALAFVRRVAETTEGVSRRTTDSQVGGDS
jgi:uncharacterized membrane protein YjdF